jgi:VWFA-related protein
MRILKYCAAIPVFVCAALLASAQPPSQNAGRFRISIAVAALNRAGVPDTSLKQSDFKVTEDGVVQQITGFAPPDAGSNILLILDHNNTWLDDAVSGRAAMDAWQKIQIALSNFVRQLQPQDRISVATFDDKVQLALPWRTHKGPPVTLSLKVISSRQSAIKDLYGTIQWATRQFDSAKGRKLIVIFTDGRDARLAPQWFASEDYHEILDPLAGLPDTGEAAELQSGLSAVRNSGIPIYFLTPFPDKSATFAGPTGWDYHLNGISGNSALAAQYLAKVRSRLEQFAEVSGGRVFYLTGPESTTSTLSQLPATLALNQSYDLEYTSSRPADNQFHRIEVRIRDGELTAAQSRTGYYAK